MKKVIVITGANGGVGGMLALGLAKRGNHIVCLHRGNATQFSTEERINLEAKVEGGSASSEIVDMMDEAQVREAGERIKAQFGRIDVWINNVGVNNHNAIGRTWELKSEDWWREVSLNLYTAYMGTTTAINLMKDQPSGYILNLGGGGVQHPKPYGSAYGAAKTAIVKFTETVSLELEQEKLNIKIFAFNPGFIRNKRTERLVESEVCKEFMPRLKNTLENGVMSDIEDSIELVDTLISGRADALAGRYFLADDRDIEQNIESAEQIIAEQRFLLVVKE